jgi:uridylate kinase
MFKKVLLKFSGEALAGDAASGIDPQILDRIAGEVIVLAKSGIQVAMVIGGGNLFRGQELSKIGIGRITGDYMGMLSTIINALAMRDAIERAGFTCRIMSAIPMPGVVDNYDRRKAIEHLKNGMIVIFAGGTGNPLVTNVDGIYDRDPFKYADAKLYRKLSFKEALQRELGVMDLAAFCQCRDHAMKIIVFNVNKAGAIQKVIDGEEEGTIVE